MGMDVYGIHATSGTGKYFRNNVWWWHPLWDYCQAVSEVARSMEGGHYNDGHGLDPEQTAQLVSDLERELEAGRTAAYAAGYQAGPRRARCKECGAWGSNGNMELVYPFSTDNVTEFVAFLRDSGGFEIH